MEKIDIVLALLRDISVDKDNPEIMSTYYQEFKLDEIINNLTNVLKDNKKPKHYSP